MRISFCSLIFSIAAIGTMQPALAQSAASGPVVVTNSSNALQLIPRYVPNSKREFKSWTIFVVCNARWTTDQDAMTRLHSSFEKLGNAIGNEGLAVWPSETGGQAYDITAGIKLCRKLRLKSEDSPYLVTMASWPGYGHKQPMVKVGLGGLPVAQTEMVVTDLANQINNGTVYQNSADASYRMAWLSAIFSGVGPIVRDIADRINFKAGTPFWSIEVTPAKGKAPEKRE